VAGAAERGYGRRLFDRIRDGRGQWAAAMLAESWAAVPRSSFQSGSERGDWGHAMKPASELLTEMAAHAKQAEDSAAAARTENQQQLEARSKELEAELNKAGDDIEVSVDDAQAQASANWKKLQTSLHDSFAEKRASVKEEIDAQRDSHDAKRAAKRADRAEADADAAIQFAIAAIDQAEYAVIDATLARMDADALVG
jgi:hypothetical protein